MKALFSGTRKAFEPYIDIDGCLKPTNPHPDSSTPPAVCGVTHWLDALAHLAGSSTTRHNVPTTDCVMFLLVDPPNWFSYHSSWCRSTTEPIVLTECSAVYRFDFKYVERAGGVPDTCPPPPLPPSHPPRSSLAKAPSRVTHARSTPPRYDDPDAAAKLDEFFAPILAQLGLTPIMRGRWFEAGPALQLAWEKRSRNPR